MVRENIILTGFMGTGKTTVGKLLARQLGYEFIDTDELIQLRAGQSIPDIFRTRGEAAFRKMESAIARELGERCAMVISTGGRLMLDPENAAALARTGRVFCLVATAREIMERVANDSASERPLLTDADPFERVLELLEQRKLDYERFPQLVTSGKTPDQVAKNILGIFNASAQDGPS